MKISTICFIIFLFFTSRINGQSALKKTEYSLLFGIANSYSEYTQKDNSIASIHRPVSSIIPEVGFKYYLNKYFIAALNLKYISIGQQVEIFGSGQNDAFSLNHKTWKNNIIVTPALGFQKVTPRISFGINAGIDFILFSRINNSSYGYLLNNNTMEKIEVFSTTKSHSDIAYSINTSINFAYKIIEKKNYLLQLLLRAEYSYGLSYYMKSNMIFVANHNNNYFNMENKGNYADIVLGISIRRKINLY